MCTLYVKGAHHAEVRALAAFPASTSAAAGSNFTGGSMKSSFHPEHPSSLSFGGGGGDDGFGGLASAAMIGFLLSAADDGRVSLWALSSSSDKTSVSFQHRFTVRHSAAGALLVRARVANWLLVELARLLEDYFKKGLFFCLVFFSCFGFALLIPFLLPPSRVICCPTHRAASL